MKPNKGKILFNDKDIFSIDTKKLARDMAILPQEKDISMDITVRELVSYGRHPHLGFGKRLNNNDKEIIDWALEQTGMIEFRDRDIMSLSGGERQRAWISMALAQKPKVLIMDEPTTYLDISYQLEVLELVKQLNKKLKLTVIMVLHDLNQASRYSDRILVLNKGKVYGYGSPQDIIKPPLFEEVFKIQAHIYMDEVNDCTYFIPHKKF
jgi:iron complex transport system ATP-binding protein